MPRLGDEIFRPIVKSLDDTPVQLRPVGDVARIVGRQGRRNQDGVHGIDRTPDGMPDGPDAPHPPHRPGDGDGSGGTPDPNRPLRPGEDRGDGRDINGHFVGGENRPWVDREQIGLDNVSDQLGVDIVRDQVASRHPSTGDQIRFYDGLFPNGDGTWTGIEVKSGSAGRSPAQNLFDGAVSVETPAIANLPDVGQIRIVKVILERVP